MKALKASAVGIALLLADSGSVSALCNGSGSESCLTDSCNADTYGAPGSIVGFDTRIFINGVTVTYTGSGSTYCCARPQNQVERIVGGPGSSKPPKGYHCIEDHNSMVLIQGVRYPTKFCCPSFIYKKK